ncbi:MAG: hypothetical protein U1F68_20035 [Gammaproteobacteria bacterium]
MEDVLEVDHTGPAMTSARWWRWMKRVSNCSAKPCNRCPRSGVSASSDYEYVRNGTANLVMLSEPLTGQRTLQ